jgi:tetratricopeptide (TPR) repeat protein
VTREEERQLAVDLFNEVWRLMESRANDDRMLHAAHASRYHWGEVGEAKNLARGEWQCSRVYTVLGRAEPALHHARRCLAICEYGKVEDWDLPYAYEAIARAYLTAGDLEKAESYAQLAREAGENVSDLEDREHLFEDLATLP